MLIYLLFVYICLREGVIFIMSQRTAQLPIPPYITLVQDMPETKNTLYISLMIPRFSLPIFFLISKDGILLMFPLHEYLSVFLLLIYRSIHQLLDITFYILFRAFPRFFIHTQILMTFMCTMQNKFQNRGRLISAKIDWSGTRAHLTFLLNRC